MKQNKGEIAVSNRHLYYYASLIKRIYGFIIRNQGENIPEERYIGRLGQDPVHSPIASAESPQIITGREPGTPDPDEIILFRFRKRLLLGACQTVLSRAVSEITVLSEDGRRLRFHHTNLVYLTGISTTDIPLKAYATAVHALCDEIDLQDLWDIASESDTNLSFFDVGDLFWNTDIDATQWIALYLHLHRACPYFLPQQDDTYTPVSANDIALRLQNYAHRKDQDEEREEFIQAMRSDDESLDDETLTLRQKTYLEHLKQYALWGRESKNATEAQALLIAICQAKKSRQRAAVDLLIRKNIWASDQNLDLLRAEVPTTFSDKAIREAESATIDTRNRKKQNVFVIQSDNDPKLAISFRRPLIGGPEFGIHIPDLTSLVPADSHLDQTAAERMMRISLPDHPISMLPTRFSHDLGNFQPQQTHPALSIYWRMTRDGRLKDYCITQTTAVNIADLTSDNIDKGIADTSHPQHRALQFFAQLADRLRTKREAETHVPQISQSLADEIVRELSLLAGVAVGRWCANKDIPAIYQTQDPIEDPQSIADIDHPIVQRHEYNRQTPNPDLTTTPGTHHGYGLSHYCPITQPTTRYTDLIMQRQIARHLHAEQMLYSVDDLNTIRYRMWETEGLIDGLVYRHSRDLLLQSWQNQNGQAFRAIILHNKIHGVLIELLDYPFKTVIYPGHALEVGEEITVQLTGIDRWKGWAHFTPSYPTPHPRP